jgi:hypothetical protein
VLRGARATEYGGVKARLTRLARALALAACTAAPLAAVTAGVGTGTFSAAAEAGATVRNVVAEPASAFALGSEPMRRAQEIARAHWGADACGGRVEIAWQLLASEINAQSSWTNPSSAYDHPQLNGSCRIAFNARAQYDWVKFCTVVVHEYGHLNGKPHAGDPGDVMAAFYSRPLDACGPAGTTGAGLAAAAGDDGDAAAPASRSTTLRAKTATAKKKVARKHRTAKKPRKGSKRKHRASRKHRRAAQRRPR